MLRWIALATACGLPRHRPIGQTPGGLPVGAQLIGPRGADSRTIAIAEAIEDQLGGFVAPHPLEASP
jgi:amidase